MNMALASAPSTPERAPPSIRRSFTAPISSFRAAVPITEGAIDGAETLYAHSAGKIISFNHASTLGRRHSSVSNGRAEFQEESSGTLPWASTTERTIAAGPLRIYRVLGSVAFLNSGNTLHPILAKSQCWCVDGLSKFVLRIRPNTYYRIELPYGTSGNKLKVEELKAVLSKLLRYEATPCPFKRGFTVDLPEPPSTPIQKRPWRPKSNLEVTPENAAEDLQRDGLDQESRPPVANSDRDYGKNNMFGRQQRADKVASSDVSGAADTQNGIGDEATDEIDDSLHDISKINYEETLDMKTPTRPKSLRTGRTVTAPPQLTVKTTSSCDPIPSLFPVPGLKRDSPSQSSSMDSFHSFHSPISPLAPSPPFPDDNLLSLEDNGSIDVHRIRNHKRDRSEITITADSSELWDMSSAKSNDESTYLPTRDIPGTPTLMSDGTSQDEDHWSEAVTPSPTKEIRQRPRRRRTQSPLPPSANLYSPYSPRSHMSGHHLTTAILQRTCSLLLGPPVQLVALMLRIAAKLAKGSFRGISYGYGEGGQKIPCSWDFSDNSDDSEEFWEEDDYGVPLSRQISKDPRVREGAGSWEID